MDKKEKIKKKLKENNDYLKKRLGYGISFDIGVRELKCLNRDIAMYYVNGLCDSEVVVQIIRVIDEINANKKTYSAKDALALNLPHQQVETTELLDESVDRMLSGLLVIFIDGESEAFIVDVRKYPGRQPEEPDTEKVVRGSRDGYTENIIENAALTRRRIRDERLRHEILQVGERSKTDVCISYLQDVADPGLVDTIKKELEKINTDGVPMADKAIEEYIVNQGWNPFPLVRYTERPDVAATHLFEGHIVIIVDTSPSVIILPTTFFHHVQHAEEYRQSPGIGAYIRWLRFAGMFVSIFILPVWYLYVLEPGILPEWIDFIGPDKDHNVPIILQLLFAELGIGILRMASIHVPTPLSTAMGLIAAVLIGEIAINVGLFVPEVILYVAIATIGSYSTPSYELGITNKIVRIFLLLAVLAFKLPGLVIGVTLLILYLVSIQNLNTPYLWPFIPFNAKAFLKVLVRISDPLSKTRPSIVKPQNPKKKPV